MRNREAHEVSNHLSCKGGNPVVAKLRRKVPKFALLVDRSLPDTEQRIDVVSETFEVLLALGHSEADARRLVDTALQTKTKFKDSGEMIQAIYQNSR